MASNKNKHLQPLEGYKMKNLNLVTFEQLNDTQKQNLASKMLDVHPTRLNNSIVEYILAKSYEDLEAPFSWDDVTNNECYGSVEINGFWEELTEEERDEKVSELEDEQTDLEIDDPKWDEIQEAIDQLNEMDFDQQPEIFQWFSCSDWLISELEDLGQCTLDGEYWGRQCCGQSIILDHCIQQAAFNWFCSYGDDGLDPDFVAKLG